MPQDAVWIIGAGPLQCAMLEQARSLGLAVVMSDRNPQAPGAPLADAFLALDTMDVAAHQQAARQIRAGTRALGEAYRLRGCCTAGADVAPSVAAVAEVLGTPGIPLAVAQHTHDKYLVRLRLEANALQRYQPEFQLLHLQRALMPILLQEASERWGWPLVLKPLSQCASRGVSILHGPADIPAAVAKARVYGERVILEQGLRGSEHSAELIRTGTGRRLFFNIVDRCFRYDGGIALELGHVNPTRLHPDQQDAIEVMLAAAADALGVTAGPCKADVLWTTDGPKILECAARLSGGWDCQSTTPLSSGRNPMRVVLCQACGLPVRDDDLAWSRHQYAACAAILPPPGRFVTWEPGIWAEMSAAVERLVFSVQPGDVIPPYEHCATRPGFAICVANTYDEAWSRASTAAERLAAAMHTVPEEPADAP